MPVTQTGIFKQPQRLAYLLASSATWKALCGVATDALALPFIHVHAAQQDPAVFPRSVCGWQDADHLGRRKTTRDDWQLSGTLTMSIELSVPSTYAKRSVDAHNWFMNQVGAIIAEMEVNAGKGEPVTGETHLNVTAFTRIDGPWEYADEEVEVLDPELYSQTHVFWMVFSVEFS